MLSPMRRYAAVLLLVALLTATCSTTDEPAVPSGGDPIQETAGRDVVVTSVTASTAPVATTLPDPGEGMRYEGELVVPQALDGFTFGSVWLDGDELAVGVADTSDLRQHGLMFVENLGDLDGMVFVFEQDRSGGFWMKDTLIPLDIAFFDSAGEFVDGFAMEPCQTADCPSYVPSGAYRYALEMAEGTMPEDVQQLSLVEPEG